MDLSRVARFVKPYAVRNEDSRYEIGKGSIAAKSRLAKKNLTIPRLELVSAHMAANLVENVRTALEGFQLSQSMGGAIAQ